ncbi:MAG: hypothetical protein IIU09_02390, partial [Bacteroidales bacterium]|nr:hypothetical protein [Bacteroidales bacterium]
RPDGGFEPLVALSQQVELGDFVAGFEWYNAADVDFDDEDCACELLRGNTFRPRVSWAPSEKFDMGVVSNIYTRMGALYDLNAGAFFHYFPIEAIQLHAALGWDLNSAALTAMAGIKVNLHIFQR